MPLKLSLLTCSVIPISVMLDLGRKGDAFIVSWRHVFVSILIVFGFFAIGYFSEKK